MPVVITVCVEQGANELLVGQAMMESSHHAQAIKTADRITIRFALHNQKPMPYVAHYGPAATGGLCAMAQVIGVEQPEARGALAATMYARHNHATRALMKAAQAQNRYTVFVRWAAAKNRITVQTHDIHGDWQQRDDEPAQLLARSG